MNDISGNVTFGPKECRYDFRKRMASARVYRTDEFLGAPVDVTSEILLEGEWALIIGSNEPVVLHAAADLRDFLQKRCHLTIEPKHSSRIITIAVAPEKSELTSRIIVSENAISITGATPRETAHGCYRLEDELIARDRPALKLGNRTYTRMFSPRMTHSGYEIEKFPDWHMDQIAHAGMDAILVYITEPPDITRNGKEDMNALVKRAAEHGLDVYAYFDRWGKPIEKHPLDPGAEEYYDSLFGSIVKNAPGIKGMICVGESCSFPSRDEGVFGYAWEGVGINEDPDHPKKGCNGFWPASDWKECLELITKVTRKYNPSFDVVFWTYNWFQTPEKDRVAMLERIPTDVTLHVTYEMGDVSEKKLGIDTWIDDYSITRPGPGTTFVSEAAVAGRRGIRLTSMTNTGGRTWDFGAIPFEPAPFRWLERFSSLKEARAKYGLVGLMDEHHYGFTPNFIAEIAKCAFTEETSQADIESCLESIAARDFGHENTALVIAAWKDWSEAMKWHSARVFDQYGPLRTGPTYPFFFYGEMMPAPPQCLGENGNWKYVCRDPSKGWARIDKSYFAPYAEMALRELKLWEAGNAKLSKALPQTPTACREAAARMLGIGEFCYRTTCTSRNIKRFWMAGLVFKDESAPSDVRHKALVELLGIIDDEYANVNGLIPFVEADSQLGWEPSMRYVADAECLKWKLGQLDNLKFELSRGN